MCFDFLYNFFYQTFLILRRNERDVIKNFGLQVKYLLFFCDFNKI